MEHPRFVRLDIHKERISIAVAESGRSGAVEYLGDISNDPVAIGTRHGTERGARRLGSLNEHHYQPTASSRRAVLTTPSYELPQPAGRRVPRVENVFRPASVGSVSSEDGFQAKYLLRHTKLHSTVLLSFNEYQQDQRVPTRPAADQ
jgi:hypothetical protein